MMSLTKNIYNRISTVNVIVTVQDYTSVQKDHIYQYYKIVPNEWKWFIHIQNDGDWKHWELCMHVHILMVECTCKADIITVTIIKFNITVARIVVF